MVQRTCPVGRDPCVPPPTSLSFRASARRGASALGVHTGVGIRPSEKRDGLPRRCAPRNDSASRWRDVEDAVPYETGQGVRTKRADRVVRPYDGDGKRVRRDGGDGVSCGWCTARNRRAGSMCPAARCALTPAGHAGPALHGDSALCRWADRVIRPYRWDVEDAVPRADGTSRTPSPTDGTAGTGDRKK